MGCHNYIEPNGHPALTCPRCHSPCVDLECHTGVMRGQVGPPLPPVQDHIQDPFRYHLRGAQLWANAQWHLDALHLSEASHYSGVVWAIDLCDICPYRTAAKFLMRFDDGVLVQVERVEDRDG